MTATTAGHFDDAASRLEAPDPEAAARARARHAELLKPPGSLGVLEDLGVRLAGMAGACPPPVPEPAAVAVFAGDHGVHDEGVTPWPREITARMVEAMAGGKAAVCVLAGQMGAEVTVVDVGVAEEPGAAVALHRNVRRGTRNLTREPAMTLAEARAALDVGAGVAADLAGGGARCLVGGEMGIANTTASAALLAALLDLDPEAVTGRGTGIDDGMLRVKVDAVTKGVERTARAGGVGSPLEQLASLGGLEIAALAGFYVGAAAARVPVVVDGLIACAAAVAAEALAPGTSAWMVAGHRSTEPGAAAALDHLGLRPLLDLDLRLGEGTGAVLALPHLQAAALLLRDMGSLSDLGL